MLQNRFIAAWTLYAGLAIIIGCTALVWLVDAPGRDWARIPDLTFADLPRPTDHLERLARFAAGNITGINWVGFLLALDGLLVLVRAPRHDDRPLAAEGSPLRTRPNRFIVAWLTSIPVWCFFDWINFYHMHAWDYHGLPPRFEHRIVGYFVAFAAISPGMFLAAELYQRLGVRQIRTRDLVTCRRLAHVLSIGVLLLLAAIVFVTALAQRSTTFALTTLGLVGPGLAVLALGRRLMPAIFAFGLSFTAWAILVRDPLGNLALWVGLIYLLDPLVAWSGGPSIIRDWQAGRFGRTAALMMGGATCGLLWEFWNYHALAKWTYNLPFLGHLEQYRYFEMPLLGFLGFLPFAIECWVMLNAIIAGLERCGLRLAEPLPDEFDAVI